MKRFIFAILFCTVCFTTNAQLVVKQKIEKEEAAIEPVCIVRRTYSTIYYSPIQGYILSIKSENRYDSNYLIDLGKRKIDCLKTLDTLILLGKGKEEVVAESFDEKMIIKGDTFLGIAAVFFFGNNHAGSCSINVRELESAYEKVKKYKGK